MKPSGKRLLRHTKLHGESLAAGTFYEWQPAESRLPVYAENDTSEFLRTRSKPQRPR